MPISTQDTNDNKPPTSTTTTSSQKLHPCLRAYNGKCNFGRKCKYATLPLNCCLSFLKGKCKDPKCTFQHVSLPAATTTSSLQKQQPHVVQDDEWELKEITDLMMIGDSLLANNNNNTPSVEVKEEEVPKQQQQQETSSTTIISSPQIEFEKQLQEMKKSRDSLIEEKKKMTEKFKISNEELTKQLESRIAAEREKNAKLQREVDELKFQLQVQKDTSRLFDEQLMKNKDNNSKSNFIKIAEEELKALREKVQIEALSLSRLPLLSKVFDIAAERFKQSTGSCNYSKQYPSLTRSECLFSGVSPVAEQFFKACPPHVFAQVIDPNTGDLNAKHFDIVLHGTRGAVPAALNIQCTGFDPKRRAGQAMGPGEYCVSAFFTFRYGHSLQLLWWCHPCRVDLHPRQGHSSHQHVRLQHPRNFWPRRQVRQRNLRHRQPSGSILHIHASSRLRLRYEHDEE